LFILSKPIIKQFCHTFNIFFCISNFLRILIIYFNIFLIIGIYLILTFTKSSKYVFFTPENLVYFITMEIIVLFSIVRNVLESKMKNNEIFLFAYCFIRSVLLLSFDSFLKLQISKNINDSFYSL